MLTSSQDLWAAMLSWQYIYISKMTYKSSKLGHTDLLFGSSSEFISKSVHDSQCANT